MGVREGERGYWTPDPTIGPDQPCARTELPETADEICRGCGFAAHEHVAWKWRATERLRST